MLPKLSAPFLYGIMCAITIEWIQLVPRGWFVAIYNRLMWSNNIEENHYNKQSWEGLLLDLLKEGLDMSILLPCILKSAPSSGPGH